MNPVLRTLTVGFALLMLGACGGDGASSTRSSPTSGFSELLSYGITPGTGSPIPLRRIHEVHLITSGQECGQSCRTAAASPSLRTSS